MADKKNKTPFYLIDTQSQFYKPTGTRVVICVSVVLWAATEIWAKEPFWSVIAVALAAYCFYVLFWTYTPPLDPPPRPPDPEEDEEDEEEIGAAPTEQQAIEARDGEDKDKS